VIVEAQTGETASAVARLPRLLNAHYFSWLSFAPLTPALLRIDPLWDPLRDDPLFQKLTKEGQLRSQAFFARCTRNWLGATELSLVAADLSGGVARVCQNTSAAFRTAKRLQLKVEC
jgi:hypothetical protein